MRIGEATMRPVVEQTALLFPPQMCFSDFMPPHLCKVRKEGGEYRMA